MVKRVVIVTASNERQAHAVEQELEARQTAGIYGKNVEFFTVPDPSSARVGSGGATLNALVTAEELAAAKGFDIRSGCVIFMIHSGGDSQRLPAQSVCGKAWSALPCVLRGGTGELAAPFDLLLRRLFSLFSTVREGLVIASSDVLLLVPPGVRVSWPQDGAAGLAFACPKEYGPRHGVYHVEEDSGEDEEFGGESASWETMSDGSFGEGREAAAAEEEGREARGSRVVRVTSVFQKASEEELRAAGAIRSDDTVWLDTGVVYLSGSALATVLRLASTPPLHCCTYAGVDSSASPLRIELYSDILLAMGGGMGRSFAEYRSLASSESDSHRLDIARSVLWQALRAVNLYAAVIPGAQFFHVGTTSEYLDLLVHPSTFASHFGLRRRAAVFQAGATLSSELATEPTRGTAGLAALNTLLHNDPVRVGEGAAAEHCELWGAWSLGRGALASSVRSVPGLAVADHMAVQEVRLANGGRVLSVLGVGDDIKRGPADGDAKVVGVTWAEFMRVAGEGVELWKEDEPQVLWTARLFPVQSGPAEGESVRERARSISTDTDGEDPAQEAEDAAALWLQDASKLAAGTTSGLLYARPDVIERWRAADRTSLRDILAESNPAAEFAWRRHLRGRIDGALLGAGLVQRRGVPLGGLLDRLARARKPLQLDSTLPTQKTWPPHSPAFSEAAPLDLALEELDRTAASAARDVAAHALAAVSALLWSVAEWGTHDARSGPASHPSWQPALDLLEPALHAAANAREEDEQRREAVALMAALRAGWMRRRHLCGRAARHYERAAGLLVAACVRTAPLAPLAPAAASAVAAEEESAAAREVVADEVAAGSPPLRSRRAKTGPPVMAGRWVVATVPARVDLAGGWSDTPPICFQAGNTPLPSLAPGASSAMAKLASLADRGGGCVVNVAVNVDGRRPIGARVRLLSGSAPSKSTFPVVIRTRSSEAPDEAAALVSGAPAPIAPATPAGGPHSPVDASRATVAVPDYVVSEVRVHETLQLRDFDAPAAAGALVKAALVVLGVVDLAPEAPPLEEQIRRATQGEAVGIEIETWSELPRGSGLGTSSILAAAVLAAIARALGGSLARSALCHLVLKLEQALTTGGGYQDQAGGIWPGVKASLCPQGLPVRVSVAPLGDPETARFLDRHLFLVYTGMTRLAKNLLARVLRLWALRENGVTGTVARLRANALDCAAAVEAKDPAALGRALETYWELKKRMAADAEPPRVTTIRDVLRPLVHGSALAGAGGGGFLVAVSKTPGSLTAFQHALETDPRTAGLRWSVHSATVDDIGLQLDVENF